jgi:DNA-binding CsgD family transcriptional regulator
MQEMFALLNADRQGVIGSLKKVTDIVRADYYWHFRPFNSINPLARIQSNFSVDYIEDYLAHKYQRVDPVVVTSLSTNILTWWETDSAGSRDPAAEMVIRDRFAQGCTIGVSLPIRGKGGQFSIFSLWARDRSAFRDGVVSRFDWLHTYALYLHDALFRHSQEPHGLSDTELELLRWTALGKTAWEISVLVSLPERTVHYHLAEASRKLGAPNKTAAVCIALKANLLDVEP